MEARQDRGDKRARSAVMPCSVWIANIADTIFLENGTRKLRGET